VTLDALYVEGLVHITELGGEYFRFDEARQELRGERTGIRYASAHACVCRSAAWIWMGARSTSAWCGRLGRVARALCARQGRKGSKGGAAPRRWRSPRRASLRPPSVPAQAARQGCGKGKEGRRQGAQRGADAPFFAAAYQLALRLFLP
jgi:ribonuclease R